MKKLEALILIVTASCFVVAISELNSRFSQERAMETLAISQCKKDLGEEAFRERVWECQNGGRGHRHSYQTCAYSTARVFCPELTP